MNTKRKTYIKKDDFFSSNYFCTGCGKSLDDFAFSKSSCDEEYIRLKLNRCIADGKFKGDICSKFFITCNKIIEQNSIDDQLRDITFPEDEA